MHIPFLLTSLILMNDIKMRSYEILLRKTHMKYTAVFTVK